MSQDDLPEFARRWAARERPTGAHAAFIVAAYLFVFWAALPTGLYLLGRALDAWLALPALASPIWSVGGWVSLILGVGLVLWSTALFWFVGGGLPISHLPPTRLVTSGPYSWMSHPIYVGYTVGWLGFGAQLGSLGCVLFSTAALLLAWHLYTRLFEEPILRARFGAANSLAARVEAGED